MAHQTKAELICQNETNVGSVCLCHFSQKSKCIIVIETSAWEPNQILSMKKRRPKSKRGKNSAKTKEIPMDLYPRCTQLDEKNSIFVGRRLLEIDFISSAFFLSLFLWSSVFVSHWFKFGCCHLLFGMHFAVCFCELSCKQVNNASNNNKFLLNPFVRSLSPSAVPALEFQRNTQKTELFFSRSHRKFHMHTK